MTNNTHNIYIYIHVFMSIYIVYIMMYVYIHMYMYMYMCIYIHIYTHVYMCVYVCVYIYIYTHYIDNVRRMEAPLPCELGKTYQHHCLYHYIYNCYYYYYYYYYYQYTIITINTLILSAFSFKRINITTTVCHTTEKALRQESNDFLAASSKARPY